MESAQVLNEGQENVPVLVPSSALKNHAYKPLRIVLIIFKVSDIAITVRLAWIPTSPAPMADIGGLHLCLLTRPTLL